MYELLGENEEKALALDQAIRGAAQDGWRGNHFKLKKVKKAVSVVVNDELVDSVLEVAKHHNEY